VNSQISVIDALASDFSTVGVVDHKSLLFLTNFTQESL